MHYLNFYTGTAALQELRSSSIITLTVGTDLHVHLVLYLHPQFMLIFMVLCSTCLAYAFCNLFSLMLHNF